jgi:ATP phosphoribosyltransferase
MTMPLILAVPSKGRLQEQTQDFFARAGLKLVQPRGARDYRGALEGVDGVEVAYFSASEITAQLAHGAVHLDADTRVVMLSALGFGYANVVVAVPQAWIDVRTLLDLDDVASAFHARHDRKMRVATKYVNLTRAFFARHGISEYRIVESLGATEGAPAAGTAEMIVDITTTGATLAANGLKVLDDGIMLRSQANLVAAKNARWDDAQRSAARAILDRIAAQERAHVYREVRTRFAGCNEALLDQARTRFRVVSPFGGPTSSGMLTLHCPPDTLPALADFLRENGAESVSVVALDYVFARENPLYEKLAARLG